MRALRRRVRRAGGGAARRWQSVAAAPVAVVAAAVVAVALQPSIAPSRVAAAQSTGRLDSVVNVSPAGPVRRIADALERVADGGRVHIAAGVYTEPMLTVQRPVRIHGAPGAILDGQGARGLIVVNASDVTIRGLTFRNTGGSQTEDRAALRLFEGARCTVEDNRFEDTFFAVMLQEMRDCVVRRNVMRGMRGTQSRTANGVHLWSSDGVLVEDNVIVGHRDGIYFEFASNAIARRNTVTSSLRYGLHFMFSDDCRYEANRFEDNQAGVAVMYAKRVQVVGNVFHRNRGSAAYGLLLKDINDSEVRDNAFTDNTVALLLEGSNRNRVHANRFEANGWAVRLLANAQDNLVERNVFARNLFDVGTNSRSSYSTLRGNHWDRYRGYDLDRDGTGDVPHAPVRLFALVVERAPAALVLVRSLVADALDLAERVAPVLTPATLVDEAPLMRRPALTEPTAGAPRARDILTTLERRDVAPQETP
ncbi:MAG TPA: nitrous oxide reductase family maturation protein NosD [Gemmatimonadaceae bacterium]|nr:nitrous oxide reductase family maturation protein NosD [Gemmatimonadaceae bacterium]